MIQTMKNTKSLDSFFRLRKSLRLKFIYDKYVDYIKELGEKNTSLYQMKHVH